MLYADSTIPISLHRGPPDRDGRPVGYRRRGLGAGRPSTPSSARKCAEGDPGHWFHHLSGAFSFTVKSGAAATATPAPTSTSSQATTSTGTTTTTGATPFWVPILVGVLALLIGLVAGLAIDRRRRAPSVAAGRKAVQQEEQEEESARHQ